MHLFLIRLSKDHLLEEHQRSQLLKQANQYAADFFPSWTNHKTCSRDFDQIQFFSWHSDPSFSNRIYNIYDEQKEELTGYVGAPIGKGASIDFRTATAFDAVKPNELMGQFAYFKIGDRRLRLYGDNVGFHCIFYYHNQEENAWYVGNSIKLLKLTKTRKPNLDFFVELYVLGGENWGNHTEDLDIRQLGEYGAIEYSEGKFSIDSWHDYRGVIESHKYGSTEDYLKQAAERYAQAADYIEKYHRCIIGLSGGFDSRLVLSMFKGRSLDDCACFTFQAGHGRREMRLSQKLARYHGLPFHFIQFDYSDLPSLEALTDESKRIGWEYRPYTNAVTHTILSKCQFMYTKNLAFQPSGTCGDVGTARYAGARPTVQELLDWRVNRKALNPDYHSEFIQKEHQFLSDRFGDFKDDIADSYFFFENPQSTKFSYTVYQQKDLDLFPALISTEFMNLCFSMPPERRFREAPGSPHHLLLDAFTQGEYPKYGFDKHPHWESGNWVKAMYKLDDLKKRALRKFFHRADYFTNLRMRYMEDHRDWIIAAVQKHKDSEFMSRINAQWIKDCCDDKNEMINHYKELTLLVPILIYLYE
ncbi:MAG: hypothetical protein JXR73_22110 [Candidatus Omnitrophica bacterium]|nr:hypothetical protein [Candidatus Omnitrophota bacterium]